MKQKHTMEILYQSFHLLIFLKFTIAFCPYKCTCDDDSLEVSCVETKLEVMPMTLNPSIRTLILKNNDFHSVDASFNFYPELQLVDLSENQLVAIPDKAFSSQRRLIELRINGNKISQLTKRTFSGLVKLQSLDMKENFIKIIPNHVFKSAKSLKELNLCSNRISEVHKHAFIELKELTTLNLSDNLLEEVPTDALKYLSNLAELVLSKNNLKTLGDYALPSLDKLTVLDFSGNKIDEVVQTSFSLVKNIKKLNLNDNLLQEVPTSAFKSFQKLEDLRIGQNMFSLISEGAFSGLTKLTKLDIAGCPNLTKISANAFMENSDLEIVKISSNRQLEFIHPQAFGPLPNLKHVDLSNNAFTTVSKLNIPWMSLLSVDISGNPWNCDCESIFLKEVIIQAVNTSATVHIVRCWNPPNLRDKDIAFLQMNCDMKEGSKAYESDIDIEEMVILIVISSSSAVVLIVLFVIFFISRKKVHVYIKEFLGENNCIPVNSKEILQYKENPEKQYALPVHPMITVNPYQQSLVRHDQYFITLSRQQNMNTDTDTVYQLGEEDMRLDQGNVPVVNIENMIEFEEGIYQCIGDPK